MKKTKLYVERRGLRRVNFWAAPQTLVAMLLIRDRYKAVLGRDVSTTIIVRRALELLTERLSNRAYRDLAIGGDAEEAAAVLRCVR